MGADQETGLTGESRPLRVLHLRDSPWIDGPGRTILETAIHVDRACIEYHVGVFVAEEGRSHPLIEEMRRRGLPVHEVVDDGSSVRAVVGRVIALIDMIGVEILHTSEFRSNVIGLLCRRRRTVHLVSTAHGWIANDLSGKLKSILDRVLLLGFDRVIAVSHATRRRLPCRWLPDARMRVLHNALAFERFKADSCRIPRKPVDPRREVTLLNVGRLSVEKGQDLLLRALAALIPEYPNLHLRFAGTGPLEPELRSLTSNLGISKHVKFQGYLSDVHAIYDSADLVIQSSFTEGLPNVILEAAYLGVPIVATNVGGTAEVLEHGVSGWLVKPHSCKELAAGIRRFLQHPAQFAAMSRMAREIVEKEFSFDARTTAQMNVYAELVRTAT